MNGRVVITNDRLFSDLIEELRDIRNYIYVHTIETGYTKEYIKYTFDGAEKHEKSSHKNINGNVGQVNMYTTSYYKNPRSFVYRLITGNLHSDNDDMLDLFITTELWGYKQSECLREFKTAIKLLECIESTSFEKEVLKRLLKRAWPNFGYYATEGLSCTDIEIIQKYDINQLQTKVGCSVDEKIILDGIETARRNGKILSLARKTHNLVYSGK